LTFRYDWLEKAGVSQPTNADEFYAAMVAFTKYGKGKAWGLGYINPSGGGTTQYFYEMFGVPQNWRLESNGTLTHMYATDEFKAAIAYIRKLYAAGIFYPDTFSEMSTQAKNNFIAGKYGGYRDGFAALIAERLGVMKTDPTAKVGLLIPFAAQGGKPVSWLASGNFGIAAIPSGIGSDRMKELLRIMDYLCAPRFSIEGSFLANGIDGWDNSVVNGTKTPNATGQKEIEDLAYIGNGVPVLYTPLDPQFALTEQGYVRQLVAMGITDPTVSLYSPTSTKQAAVLTQLFNDRFLRIVQGTDAVSTGGGFLTDFMNNGGSQILKEYEQQLQKSA
jgi:putative aldouronate transport system substrate-binding protein